MKTRTTHVRGIFHLELVHEGNGAFALKFHASTGGGDGRHIVVLHVDQFWWVQFIARELWNVVKKRRQQLVEEIGRAEQELRKGDE